MKRWPRKTAERESWYDQMWMALFLMLLWSLGGRQWVGWVVFGMTAVVWLLNLYSDYLKEQLDSLLSE